MRGRSIEGVAARVRAEASEHHGDGAVVRAVLVATFIEDGYEGGFAHDGERLRGYSRAGTPGGVRT